MGLRVRKEGGEEGIPTNVTFVPVRVERGREGERVEREGWRERREREEERQDEEELYLFHLCPSQS